MFISGAQVMTYDGGTESLLSRNWDYFSFVSFKVVIPAKNFIQRMQSWEDIAWQSCLIFVYFLVFDSLYPEAKS